MPQPEMKTTRTPSVPGDGQPGLPRICHLVQLQHQHEQRQKKCSPAAVNAWSVLASAAVLELVWETFTTQPPHKTTSFASFTVRQRPAAGCAIGFLLLYVCKILAEMKLAVKARQKMTSKLERAFDRPSRVEGAWVRLGTGIESVVGIGQVNIAASEQTDELEFVHDTGRRSGGVAGGKTRSGNDQMSEDIVGCDRDSAPDGPHLLTVSEVAGGVRVFVVVVTVTAGDMVHLFPP